MSAILFVGAWLLCWVLYAHLAAAEGAIGALGRVRLRQRARREAWLAAALDRPQELQAVILLGTSLAVTGIAAIGAVLVGRLGLALGAPSWPGVLLEAAFLLVALFVIGDDLPRTWAARKPEQGMALATPVLRLLLWSLGPLVRGWARAAAATRTRAEAAPGPAADPLAALGDGAHGPEIEPQERAMLQGAFRIRSVTTREIMTALPQLVMAEVHETVGDLIKLVGANWHSRIPVYEGQRSNVRGMLYAKDLLPLTMGGDPALTARALMRDAWFVPATKLAEELLRDFQREHLHVAVVVSEYGAAVGLVTLEDVVEEIVGEVRDEFDVEEPALRRLEDGSLLIRGEAALADVQRQLGVELPAAAGAETLEAFLLRLKPEGFARGEEIEVAGNARFRVERTAGRRIWQVRARGGEAR